MKSLLIPGLCLAALAIFLHTGLLSPPAALLAYTFYASCIAGALLARRFHSSRIFFALLILLLSQRAIDYFSSGRISLQGPGSVALTAIGLLLPLDFVLLSLRQEKGFTFATITPPCMLVFIESVIVAVLCRPSSFLNLPRIHRALLPQALPAAIEAAFAAAAIILLVRYFLFYKPTEGGLLWALAATCLALRFGGFGAISTAYFAAASVLLTSSIVETSYLLAYQDELTSLPSRRAFHESLLRLQPPYTIAMLDIDHFKRCNDSYGHDTGDEVLRLVANRLARVGGGGKAYRCGGEEFAIVYAGSSVQETLGYLEDLRVNIEASSFRLRGRDRRQEDRGTDRRKPRAEKSEKPTRQRKLFSEPSYLSVTASIGVAASSEKKPPLKLLSPLRIKRSTAPKRGGEIALKLSRRNLDTLVEKPQASPESRWRNNQRSEFRQNARPGKVNLKAGR